jgi:hypothetical protein
MNANHHSTSEELIKLLKEKRPNISNSSLKTYESILRNLYERVYPEQMTFKANKFNENSERVIDFLKDLPFNKRKTILSALVVITDNKDYRELMLDDIKEYNKEEAKQYKTKTQEENWVDKEDLTKIYNVLKHNANLIYKKENKSHSDYQQIQDYIILCLYGGFYIPPRRSKDYVNLKIKNIDHNLNYIDKNEFVFNNYKTAKTYGEQRVVIPKELKTILNKWIKTNPTDYLLFDSSYKQLSNVKLNQRLNKLFGKKAGVNQMRKTYLSDKYANLIDTKKQLEKDFKDMGSSSLQENIYIKK